MRAKFNTPTFWLVHRERVIPLAEGAYVVGRAARAELCFPEDPAMSRIHARLDVSAGKVQVEDLCSENGTWVNGHRVNGSETVASGSRLRVGATELTLHAIGPGRGKGVPTSPEVPAARAVRAAALADLATARRVDLERGLLEAERALDEGRIREARKLIDEYVVLLDVACERVPPALLTRTAAAALRLALSTRDGSYADWVSSIHRRLRRPITTDLIQIAQLAADRGVRFDHLAFGVRRGTDTLPSALN